MAETRQAAARRKAALGAIPRELAAVMRPELPSLLREMAAEIAGAIPEYGAFINGPEAHLIRLGIEQNISAFVDQIAVPNSGTELRDEICRRFGRFEAYQGRSLDALQDAYRIGCQVALRRAVVVGRRYRLSASVLMAFADALFAYMGEIAELSREGYLQAMAEMGEEPDGRRRRLLQRLLTGAGLADGSLAELAEQVGWPLPQTVTPVALHPDSRPERAALGRNVLADLTDPEPHLLVPGPLEGAEETLLVQALAESKAAVGPTVPLAEAGDSLRWARHTLALTDAPLSRADDHLLTLWLLADQALARQFARRYLGALETYTPAQRRRLLETLHVWLTTRGTAAELAGRLGVHPQTFRYRMRVLERIFGEQLADPDQRFATEVTLRALALQER